MAEILEPPLVIDLDATRAAALAQEFSARLARDASRRDQQRELAHDEVRAILASGLLTARIPARFGGPGLGVATVAHIVKHLAAGDPNVAQAVSPNFSVVEELLIYAPPAQQARYFERMKRHALIASAHAERGGVRIGDIATRLTQRDGEWRLNGTKYYCTGSLYANYLRVSALNDEGGRAFLVIAADKPGLTIADDWDGMGQRTTASGTVQFDDVRVLPEEIVMQGGWRTTRTHFTPFAQLLHSAMDTGIALAALRDGGDYARHRARPNTESGVQRAVDDPYVLHAFGEMAVLAHSAEAMVERAAHVVQEAADASLAGAAGDDVEALLGRASMAVAEAKIVSTEASLRVSEWLYRLGGASSTSASLNLDRHWRNARTHTTHDPVAYKYRALGDYHLTGTLPPLRGKT